MTAQHILLVDDDDPFRQSLAEQLELYDDFKTVQAECGSAALAAIRSDRFDAVLLDVGLPDLDGREVCRLMRKAGLRAPIIMLTAADTDSDTILGLDSGANDYVTKPFRVGILLARLRAHLRRHEQNEDAVYAIGSFSFRPGTKRLEDPATNRKIRLTEKETQILKYLYRADGNLVKRETLLGDVWGYNATVTTHTLETHVYRLRQKIEVNPANAKLIITEPGGYRLKTRETAQ